MAVNRIWICDFGEFPLPDDFPFHVLRKNGWWDYRFKKDRLRAMAFIEAETAKLHENTPSDH